MDKEFFILYFVASDALLSGRLVPCKWNQARRPSELYMCTEREKDNFKSREVNCLKECALALKSFLVSKTWLVFEWSYRCTQKISLHMTDMVASPAMHSNIILIYIRLLQWHKKMIFYCRRNNFQTEENTSCVSSYHCCNERFIKKNLLCPPQGRNARNSAIFQHRDGFCRKCIFLRIKSAES